MKLFRQLPVFILLGCVACSRSHSQAVPQPEPVELQLQVSTPFHFVAYGDSRFHDPKDTGAANPAVRQTLVQAIAQTNPAFISFGGDIVYNGYDKDDWKVWDSETAVWREKKIPVYPALGNHDLHGDEKVALANYFERFPDLKNSLYYSVRAANTLVLVLDSSLDETSGHKGNGSPRSWTIFLAMSISFSLFFTILPTPVPRRPRYSAEDTPPAPRSKSWPQRWKRGSRACAPGLLFSPDTCTTTNATSTAALPIS